MQLNEESLLLPQEAADHLRMQKQTLANWRSQGGGPQFVRVGNRIFYPMRKLRAFVRTYNSTADYGKPPEPPEAPTDGGGDPPNGKKPN